MNKIEPLENIYYNSYLNTFYNFAMETVYLTFERV